MPLTEHASSSADRFVDRFLAPARLPVVEILAGLIVALSTFACAGSGIQPVERSPAERSTPSTAIVSLELFEETLDLEAGGTLAYERGLVTVPVRRSGGTDDTLEVEFFRFPRDADAPAGVPPIFLLHGGPGFGGLGPRLENPGYFEARLSRYTRLSDLIVPGQRGFGSSTDTPCEPLRRLTVKEALDDEIYRQAIGEATARCRQKWESEGLDLTGLNVVEAAADVIDIARELGYEQIQLRGISFGSHWGMTILRNHPERIARATLTGLEGPDHTYDMPSGVLGAFERIAAEAENAPRLAGGIPEDGLLAAFGRLIARGNEEPIAVEIEHPETGEPLLLHLDGDDLREILAGTRRFTSFRFRAVRWPQSLLHMLDGDLRRAAEAHLSNRLDGDLANAAFYHLDCGSGLSRERGEILRKDPAAQMIGPIWLGYDIACAAWDADLGEAFRGPFRTSVPTVLVQGNWDTSTPYENALELRPYFQDHHFVHVEGGSHGALREALEQIDGFREAMDHWLATGETAQIPQSVTLPPMEWELDAGGS